MCMNLYKIYYQIKKLVILLLHHLDNMVYNADSGGAYNIMRLYAQEKNTSIDMVCKGLSNPNKICICVTRS